MLNTVLAAVGKTGERWTRTLLDLAMADLVPQKRIRLMLFLGEREQEKCGAMIRAYREAASLWPDNRANGPFHTDVLAEYHPLPDLRTIPEQCMRSHDPASEHLRRILWDREADSARPVWLNYLNGIPFPESAAEETEVLLLADLSEDTDLSGLCAMVLWCREKQAGSIRLLCVSSGKDEQEKRFRILQNNLDQLKAENAIPGAPADRRRPLDATLLVHQPAGMPGNALLTDRLGLTAALHRLASEDPAVFSGSMALPAEGRAIRESILGIRERQLVALTDLLTTGILPVLRQRLTERSLVRDLKPRWWFRGIRAGMKEMSEKETEDFLGRMAILEQCLQERVLRTGEMIRGMSPAFRAPDLAAKEWQQAMQLYGRLITEYSEMTLQEQEARENHLEESIPVHRHSMADTEEELMLQQLKQLQRKTAELETQFQGTLSQLGGNRYRDVIRETYARCRAALDRCQEQMTEEKKNMEGLSSSDPAYGESRSRLIRAERRKRNLQAASDRCRQDLAAWLNRKLWLVPAQPGAPVAPLENVLFAPDALSELLTAAGRKPEERNAKKVTDRVAPAAYGCAPVAGALADLDREPPEDPAELLSVCWRMCRPEREDRSREGSPVPPVDLYPENDCLTEEKPDLWHLAEHLPGAGEKKDSGRIRGMLALLLLWNTWETVPGTELLIEKCEAGTSETVDLALRGKNGDALYPVILKTAERTVPLAVLIPGSGIICGNNSREMAEALPERVIWMNRENGSLTDPSDLLSDSDAALLTQRLTMLRTCRQEPSFATFLQRFAVDISRGRNNRKNREDPDLALRAAAVDTLAERTECRGLMRRRREAYRRDGSETDDILNILAGKPLRLPPVPVRDRTVYLWRNRPFARSQGDSGLEAVTDREEKETLEELAGELQTLRQETLEWPWNPDSPSIRARITEAFDECLLDVLLNPFADRFVSVPLPEDLSERQWAETGLLFMTTAGSGLRGRGALYPLSEAVAAEMNRNESFRQAFGPDSLGAVRQEDGAVRVILALHGRKNLIMTRVYPPDEHERAEGSTLPELCQWPAANPDTAIWRTCRLYICPGGVGTEIGVPADGENAFDWMDGTENGIRFRELTEIPRCLPLRRKDVCLGCVMNLYVSRLPAPEGKAVICLDPGESGTGVLLNINGTPKLPDWRNNIRFLKPGPGWRRTLTELTPAGEQDPVLPSQVILPGETDDARLLWNGTVGRLKELDPHRVVSHLKWGSSAEGQEARKIWLRETLYQALWQARYQGARTVNWRITCPETMTAEGRRLYTESIRTTIEELTEKTGIPADDSLPAVTFVEDSRASERYFRSLAPEALRNGSMTLDFGHAATQLTVRLRGMKRAARCMRLPLGTQFMLMRPVQSHPELLEDDLNLLENARLQQDLDMVLNRAKEVRTDPRQLYAFSLTLDTFLTTYAGEILPMLDARAMGGDPTFLHSLILLNDAFLMALGAMTLDLLAMDPVMNELIPAEMMVCLAGRGSLLPEYLAPAARERILSFLNMSCVNSSHLPRLSILLSRDRKLELCMGMCRMTGEEAAEARTEAPETDRRTPVPPEEWLKRFLNAFRSAFPDAADYLFPGFFTGERQDPETLVRGLTEEAFRMEGVSVQEAMILVLDRLLESCGT